MQHLIIRLSDQSHLKGSRKSEVRRSGRRQMLGNGLGHGLNDYKDTKPQSKELVRGPPELVQHFRL